MQADDQNFPIASARNYGEYLVTKQPANAVEKCTICRIRLQAATGSPQRLLLRSRCGHDLHKSCGTHHFKDVSATEPTKCPREDCEARVLKPPVLTNLVEVSTNGHTFKCAICQANPEHGQALAVSSQSNHLACMIADTTRPSVPVLVTYSMRSASWI